MSKIAVIIGTRPEAIKLIPVFIELRKQLSKDQLVLISTGQHKEMLAQVFDLFEIQPTINLEVMENNQTLNQLIAKIFGQLDQVLTQENITSLIVQGDTSTAMASAITAFNRKINVFHVEAGLRSGNLLSPFPEEGNRKIISAFANLHFTPTMNATQNLLNEGVSAEQIKEVGNTVIDAVEMLKLKIQQNENEYSTCFPLKISDNSNFILITCHRRESFGKGINDICSAIVELSEKHPDCNFVYPVHLNPHVKEVVHQKLSGLKNVVLLDPLPYDQLLYLLSKCTFVLTDSGGIQEEAPSFGKPCLVMRSTTERTEGVESGCAVLVGNEKSKIVESVSLLLKNHEVHTKMSPVSNPYGDGKAASRIVDHILKF